jgi:hypothetical protein
LNVARQSFALIQQPIWVPAFIHLHLAGRCHRQAGQTIWRSYQTAFLGRELLHEEPALLLERLEEVKDHLRRARLYLEIF